MRIPLIGANWKMHKTPKGTTAFFETFLPLVKCSVHGEIVICPTLLDVENALIRVHAKGQFGVDAANGVRIKYGGSVKPDNARSLMEQPEIDGFLMSGASLDSVSFSAIVNL